MFGNAADCSSPISDTVGILLPYIFCTKSLAAQGAESTITGANVFAEELSRSQSDILRALEQYGKV